MGPENEIESKNRKKAIAISIGSHLILLILFFIVAAWAEPDPPIPEYGIELAFVGQLSAKQQTESAIEAAVIEEPVPLEAQEEINEQESETENDVQEEVVESTETSEQVISEDTNSPDVNTPQEEQSEVILQEKIEEVPENTSTKEDAVKEIIEETPVVVPEPEPEVDDRAIFQKNQKDGAESTESSDSGGSSLNMSGWMWDEKPNPDDKSTENGKIVFRINVDDEGEITRIETVESTVSPSVKKIYENSVMELTFSKTVGNKSVAPNSTGVITFIIRSN